MDLHWGIFPVHARPVMSDQTEDHVEKEESSADCWRRLALQFDNHRMEMNKNYRGKRSLSAE